MLALTNKQIITGKYKPANKSFFKKLLVTEVKKTKRHIIDTTKKSAK